MAQRAAKKTTKQHTAETKGLPKEVTIFIGVALAAFLELSNFGILGKLGGWLKDVQFGLFGCMAYVFPVLLAAAFIYWALAKEKKIGTIVCGAVLLLFLCVFAHMLAKIDLTQPVKEFYQTGKADLRGGGFLGGTLAAAISYAIGRTGVYILTILVIVFCLLMIFRLPLIDLIGAFREERQEEVPVRSGKKLQEEVPVRSVARKPKSRTIDEKVYETEEDGTVIRIVHARPKHKVNRARLNRVHKKARPLRDGSVRPERAGKKAHGVSSNVAMVRTHAQGDEVHEITHVRTQEAANVPKPAPEKKKSTLTVTDVKSRSGKPGVLSQSATEIPPVRRTPERQVTETKAAPVKKEESIFAAESDASRGSLSGKTLSSGEPVHTFKPETTRKETGAAYTYPPHNLLARRRNSGTDSMADVEKLGKKLEDVLREFGVSAQVIDKQVGPSVTRLELQPEVGTRVSKITSLADDLKLNLAVRDIRIEAPIPGRAAIGIEIPNKSRQNVTMRELIESEELMNHPSKIAFAAGKDISGNVIVADIAKMPHLLVAGTTGSGKSTFLNTIIMSILMRAKPSEVGLVIIDPKKIEFGVYSGIPHLLKDVVTDPGQAVSTLRWAVTEMTKRYQRMQLSGVRDFKTYNEKFERGLISEEEEDPRLMPQIVIIIDELADLMMVAAKEAESLICRLAQLARAAGIHLVIATQRPSVDVVTGLIKANIPARVALLVASGIDSRTIIDMVGAEKLLGYGDMLFYPTGYVKPLRVQGAFVSDKEIQDTVQFLKEHKNEDYFAIEAKEIDAVIRSKEDEAAPEAEEAAGAGKYDEYFHDAGLLCIESGKASSSMLQRRFNIGFNRAARIIDQLYEFGAVGPPSGAKPREILVDSRTFENMYDQLDRS